MPAVAESVPELIAALGSLARLTRERAADRLAGILVSIKRDVDSGDTAKVVVIGQWERLHSLFLLAIGCYSSREHCA